MVSDNWPPRWQALRPTLFTDMQVLHLVCHPRLGASMQVI